MTSNLKVIGIVGSVDTNSATEKAMRIILDEIKSQGVEIELIKLREYDLPISMLHTDTDMPENQKKALTKFRNKFKGINGIVLGSPEYHGSMTGALKNALDNLGFNEFKGKIVGLLGTAGGEMGATNTLNHMRLVGRNLHSWVLPNQVSIGAARSKFDDEGNCLDKKIEDRLKKLGKDMAKFVFLHHSEKVSEFVNMWLESQENPGGD